MECEQNTYQFVLNSLRFPHYDSVAGSAAKYSFQ